jgi:hypothetical protein
VVDNLAEALASDFNVRLIADVFRGPERVFQDLPVSDNWSLKFDSEGRIKASGTLLVQYTSEVADSLTPTEFTDLLAPFGPELNLLLEISVGSLFSQTILIGRYVLTQVPSARDEHMRFLDRTITTGSLVELTLQDSLVRIQRRGFHFEEQPVPSTTCWSEIARISGMQVTRNVPDAPVPAGLLYEPKEGGRLDAVQTLAGRLGGRAFVTPDNTLSVLPYTVPLVPELTLSVGARGTLIDVEHSMESEGVYSEVVGVYEVENSAGDRVPLYSLAQLTQGPLSVTGPYGAYTYFHTSNVPTNQQTADAETQAVLTQVSATQTYRVPVTCILDPRVRDGMVVEVVQATRSTVGRVVNHSFGGNGLMQLELECSRPVRS